MFTFLKHLLADLERYYFVVMYLWCLFIPCSCKWCFSLWCKS